MEPWQQFNDPVYGTVVFRHRSGRLKDYWAVMGEGVKLRGNLVECFRDIFTTVEFSRLNQLRQAGLTYLVFPSGVHTRFAHSWGCLFLGEQALSLVQVVRRGGRRTVQEGLRKFLEGPRYVDEFLLALLLHDIGHMPFSHLLEECESFAGVTHEQIACEYILGAGSFYEHMRGEVEDAWGGKLPPEVRFLNEVLAQIPQVDRAILCALISGDMSHLHGREYDKTAFTIMKNLVSGLLDLDRVDHYQRNVLFFGLRIPSPDPIAVMTNMQLWCDERATDGSIEIRLDDMGILQARNLLEVKAVLFRHVFFSPQVLAYHTMLRCAVEIYIESQDPAIGDRESLVRAIGIMTDEQLLQCLDHSGIASVQRLVRRVMSRMPYSLAGRFRLVAKELRRHPVALRDMRTACLEWLTARGLQAVSEDVLFCPPMGYFRHAEGSTERRWLNLEDVTDLKGAGLSTHAGWGSEFEPFRMSADADADILTVFVSRPELTESVGDYLRREGLEQRR